MTLVRALAVVLALLAAMPATPATEPVALHRLFPHQAEVTTEGPGLARLDLPAAVLSRCRADLSDLRLFDDRDREVPFLVLAARDHRTVVEVVHRATPAVRDAGRREERPRGGPARFVERFTLEVPPLPTAAGRWQLVLDVARPEFVAGLELAVTEGDGRRTTVLEGGSAFRLLRPHGERLRFPVPVEAVALEVVLTSEAGDFLAPTFRLEAVRQGAVAGASEVPLPVLERVTAAGRTELVVERSRGLVATTLHLRTSTGAFHRVVTVWDEGPGAGAERLGSSAIFRVDAIAPVESLEVPVAAARGDRLRLVVEDGDSPPLAELSVTALVPQPVLFFSLSEGGRRAVLRFGGARAHRPRYDLSALAPLLGDGPLTGDDAERALPFLDPGRSRPAALGPVVPNPAWDPQPALAFAMSAGAPLDPTPFSHRRRLTVTPSDEGLSRLRLGPGDLALLRPDLADLRVVDDDLRQWPYLLEPRAGSDLVAAELVRHRVADGRSRYELVPPFAPIAVERLELRVDAPFFDRAFRVVGTTPDHEELQLVTGRLVRHRGDPRPPVIELPGTRLERLELEIEDGDDAPLAISELDLATPVADLYLTAPAGTLTLLLGDPEGAAPRYELARVRGTVLAVPNAVIAAGALEPNPAFSAAARIARGSGPQRLALWVVLGIVVTALGLLTLRLARQSPG